MILTNYAPLLLGVGTALITRKTAKNAVTGSSNITSPDYNNKKVEKLNFNLKNNEFVGILNNSSQWNQRCLRAYWQKYPQARVDKFATCAVDSRRTGRYCVPSGGLAETDRAVLKINQT